LAYVGEGNVTVVILQEKEAFRGRGGELLSSLQKGGTGRKRILKKGVLKKDAVGGWAS